ncbi:MAG: hypothetical protein KAT70_08810, partial [Thermoplasmata archaeon]|nr:hypothetical protein [Thermoplasmata archaeon]
MKSQRKIVKNVGKGAQESRGSVERTPRGRRTMGKRVATLAILALLVCVPFLTVQADQLSGSDRT